MLIAKEEIEIQTPEISNSIEELIKYEKTGSFVRRDYPEALVYLSIEIRRQTHHEKIINKENK